jgi:hypothetical protein
MKRLDNVLREYASRISDEDLKFLNTCLGQRLQGDLSEALNFMSRSPDMDRLLREQASSQMFYDVIEKITEQVDNEVYKRSSRGMKVS